MKRLINEKLIYKVLSIITAFVMVFLSIAPTYTTAFAAETTSNDTTSTPDTPETSLTEQTLTATIYKDKSYKDVLKDETTEITLTGKMPKGAVVKAYPVEYDLTPTENDDQPVSGSAPNTSGEVLLSYDVSIFDGKKEFEPDGDTISVTFKSPEIEKFVDDELSVIHVKDNGEEEEIIEKYAGNGELTIKAFEFSVYVIIDHEGNTVVTTPRVKFHFISQEYSEDANHPGVYTAAPFNFYNKSDPSEYQCSQLLTNGESLELIANPPNKVFHENGTTTEKYFYGWYVVDLSATGTDTTAFNGTTWDGVIPYTWPAPPEKIEFEHTMSLTLSNGTAVTDETELHVGDTIQWTISGVTYSGKLNSEGVIDVYLAPIYEDYYFVNFRLGALNDTSNLNQSLMTRRLVVFGSASKVTVRIGDVICPSSDPTHLVFTGWQTETMANNNEHYPSVDINTGLETNSEGSTTGYYIPLTKNDFSNTIYDLYPLFTEARWLSFNNGKSGNGATYIGSTYRLTNDSGNGTYYDNAFFSTNESIRTGYTFGGWYAFAKLDENGDISNLNSAQEVEVCYVDVQGVTQKVKFNIKALKLVDYNKTTGAYSINAPSDNANLAAATVDGTTYTLSASGGNIYLKVGSNAAQKLFGVTDSKLYFYKMMDDLTLYANWEINDQTTYKVVIWKQKVTDHKDFTDDEKSYDYEIHYVSNSVSSNTPLDPTSFTDSSGTKRNLTSLNFSGFTYNTAKSDMQGKTPKSDGTSVFNIYYDRNLLTINWSTNVSGYSYTRTTENTPTTQYGWVNGKYVKIQGAVVGTYNTYTYLPSYTQSTEQLEKMYCFNSTTKQYDLLGSTEKYGYTETRVPAYVLTSTLAAGNDYLIVNSNTAGTTGRYALGYYNNGSYGTVKGVSVTVKSGKESENIPYILPDGLDTTTKWSVARSNNAYTFINGSYYLENWYGTLYAYNQNGDQILWTWDSTNFRLKNNDTSYPRYLIYSGTNFELNTKLSSIYLYALSTITKTIQTVTGYTYTYNGQTYDGTRYIENNTTPTVYTGIRYTDQACTNVTTEDRDGLFGKDANGYTFKLNRETGDIYKWTYQDENGNEQEYTGVRFVCTNSSNGTVKSFTGLYQQNLSQYGYEWPFNYSWRRGSTSGGILTYLNSFYFDPYSEASKDKKTFDLFSGTSSSGGHVYYYMQDSDGSYPNTSSVSVLMTSSNNFSITDKFTGFKCAQYREGSAGTWYDLSGPNSSDNYYYGNKTSFTTSDNNGGLHIRCSRFSYDFVFNVNYPTGDSITYGGKTVANGAARSSNLTVDPKIYYEAPLNDYGYTTTGTNTHWYYGVVNSSDKSSNTAKYELIAPDHYIFGGWYEDATCQVPFNFNSKMPAANKIVYAKWTPEKFLVKIDPNGGEIDHVNHTYDNSSSERAEQGYGGYWWNVNSTNVQELLQGSAAPVLHSDSSATRMFATFNRTEIAGEREADVGYNRDQATYINANFNTLISEYSVDRNYVPINDASVNDYRGTIYYYVNIQWSENDGSGLPSDCRNALYMTDQELAQYYNFYRDWTIGNIKGGYITAETKVYNYDTWRQLYVSKQKYRVLNQNEHYKFLGWYRVLNEGTENEALDSMPYIFSTPVTEPVTLRAVWRLDGGYQIHYHADYTMEDGTWINGELKEGWQDPKVGDATLSYADDASTTIYKQPTGITADGTPSDEYIFRGYRLVSVVTQDGKNIYTPLENGIYYDPGAPFTIKAEYADSNSFIHLQAVYEEKDTSYRRPYITNLTLDANSGYLTTGKGYVNGTWHDGSRLTADSNLTSVSGWSGIGTVAANVPSQQIEFGDIQSNQELHLYRYATTLTNVGGSTSSAALSPPGTNYFAHQNGYFLLGFDDAPNERDYIASYPADSIISIDRNQNQTIYAVWEPMIYLNFKNTTGSDIHFGLASTDSLTLYVLNEVTGLYDREKVIDPSNMTIGAGETMHLALPFGEEQGVTISGTNELGVGKVLTWNTSVKDDSTKVIYTSESGTNTDSALYGQTSYTHTHNNTSCTHALASGQVHHTKQFSFNEQLLFNTTGVTVTFGSYDIGYALILDDNYSGGGTQEYDYSREYVVEQTNSQLLPSTSTRMGYQLAGWAYSKSATVPDYSATSPSAGPWKIAYLKDFFNNNSSVTTEMINNDTTKKATLYAVWTQNTAASTVYIYNNVPAPGNQNMPFTYTLSLSGTYKNSNPQSGSFTFELYHGDYAVLKSSNHTGSGAYIKTAVTVYKADGTVRTAETEHKITPTDSTNNGSWSQINIAVKQYRYPYYDTSVERTAKSTGDAYLYIGTETDPSTTQAVTNTAHWTTTDAGGTLVFTNQRQTKKVTVAKELHSNTTIPGQFSFTASYEVDNTVVTSSESIQSGMPNTTWLANIPAGAKLTLTEGNDGSYAAKYKINDGSYTNAIDVIDSQTNAQTGSKTAEIMVDDDVTITFDNTLKSYPVKFRLLDQNNTPLSGMFSLSSGGVSYGAQRYADPNAGGIFYTSENLYVGGYTLSQNIIPTGYIGLSSPATITVTGSAITSESDMIYIASDPDVTGGYIITVYNIVPSVKINLTKKLDDPLLNQRTFSFTVSYVYELKESGSNNMLLTINPTNTYDIQATASGTTEVIEVPGGAKVTITENLSPAISAAYTTTYTVDGGQSVTDNTWTGTIGNTDTYVEFTNTRKTVNVTVKKVIVGTSGKFDFIASLKNGNNNLNRQLTVANGYYTDSTGHVYRGETSGYTTNHTDASFSLGHNGTFEMNVPYGVTLTVEESAPGSCTVEASALSNAEDHNDADEIFTFVVTGDDTVTFTNTEQQQVAPSGLGFGGTTAFIALTVFSGLLCSSYILLTKRRKEVGYDAI